MPEQDVHRRTGRLPRLVVAAVAVATLVAGCARADEGTAQPATSPSTARETSTTTTVPRLPAPPPWSPTAGEVLPNAKTLAARTVQALTTYPFGEGSVEAARQRLVAAGLPPQVADGAGALLVPEVASAGEIVYPQLAGLTGDAAAVMVVVRQERAGVAGRETVTRTVDVRLRLVGGEWAVEAVASTGGDPVEQPDDVAPAVGAVVAGERIDLPDSARWDLLRGTTDPRVVDLLARLARERRISVTVLASGHPLNVFETDRISNHTAGRGVDIWAFDGVPVVEQRGPDSPLRALVQQLAREGVTEIGSPFDLDGRGGVQFTNTVHLDHLHLAYRQ